MPARGRNRESLTPARLERALEHEQRTALTACVSGGIDLPLHRARDARLEPRGPSRPRRELTMALRKALARATALRAMAACPVSARGAATTTTTTIGRASADATASALARSHAHGGAVAAVARARRAITTRNQVENEIYDRSRQEIPLGNRVPSTAVDAWIAPNATIAGDVDVGNSSTVWHGAVLKGDLGAVRVAGWTNIMEKVVIDAAGCVLAALGRALASRARADARVSSLARLTLRLVSSPNDE
jgi:hypothetical protein